MRQDFSFRTTIFQDSNFCCNRLIIFGDTQILLFVTPKVQNFESNSQPGVLVCEPKLRCS
jgi:hypothetical protein